MLAILLAAGCAASRQATPPDPFPMLSSWTVSLPGSISGSLATDGSRVFVSTTDGTLRALSRIGGAVLWEVRGRPGLLAARRDLLVARAADGTVWGMDPSTGAARWKTDTGIPGLLDPALAGDTVLVAGSGAAALRVGDGSVIWSSTEGTASAAPAAGGTYVLIGESDGTLRARDAGTGSTVWTHATEGALLTPPIVDEEGRVLLGTTDRRFLALRLEGGDKRWTWKVGADVHRPPAVSGDLVFFSTQEDVLYALKRSNGHMVWRGTLPSRPVSGPLLHRGSVLVACLGGRPGETFIVGFDERTGRRLGDLRAPGEVQSTPVILDDRLVLAMRPDTNTRSETRSRVAALLMGVAPSPEPSPSAEPSPKASPGAAGAAPPGTPAPAPSPSLTTR